MDPNRICSRCSHTNPSRARFCANCGLNLLMAIGEQSVQLGDRAKKRNGNWLALLIVATLIIGVGFVSALRTSNRPMRRSIQYSPPAPTEIHEEEVINGRYYPERDQTPRRYRQYQSRRNSD